MATRKKASSKPSAKTGKSKSSAGKTPGKKAAKKVTTTKTRSETAKAGAKGKTKAKSKAAAKPEPEAKAASPVETPEPALPKPRAAAAHAPTHAPVPSDLAEAATETLWVLYRKEADATKGKASSRLDDLRNALIERHYPLVRYIAERLLQTLPKSIELDDLVSAGLFGQMDAIRGFDAGRGIKFKTYCSTRIRGAILDQLRSQDWVPRLVRLKAGRIDRALSKLTAEFGREPTHAELAKALEMDHDELVLEMQEARAKTMFSLSEKWEDDDGSVEKVEVLEDRTAVDPVGELNRRDLMTYLTRSLTHKERFIIEQYYNYGHTMREIGEMLALTESRVCQIHSNVMSRLKGLLGQRANHLIT